MDDATHEADLDGYTRVTTYDSQTAKLTNDASRPVTRTITNTYTPIPPEGSFKFSKLWTGESDPMPVEWPTEERIRVQFHRRLMDGTTEVAGNDDEHFLITYEIKRSYDAEHNDTVWSIEKYDREHWVLDGDVNIDPVIVAPTDPGRFYNYEFTVTGVKETAQREVAGVSKDCACEYYVTEEPIDGTEYETHYGFFKGAGANVVEGMTSAPDGKAIINQFDEAKTSFTKEWYGQNRDEKLTEWPTYVVEKDPASDEGANPDAVEETKPVPITLRLGRRLKYDGDKLSHDFDATYDVTFPNLTDQKTNIEIHPAEGKINLTMQNVGGSFEYTISRLQKYLSALTFAMVASVSGSLENNMRSAMS